MKSIDQIIFNELASHKDIGLPTMGMLSVVRIPATLIDGELTEPAHTIQFSEEWADGTQSIVDLISELGGEKETAEEAFFAWLKSAESETGLYIEGTGVLKRGKFYVTKELDRLLNPMHNQTDVVSQEKEEELEREKERERERERDMVIYGNQKAGNMDKIWKILIPIFALILIGGWGYWWYTSRSENKAPVVTQTPINQPKTEGAEGDAAAIATQTDALKGEKESGALKSSAIGQTRYHVVGGVFSVSQNADNLIKIFKQAYPNQKCEKIAFKGMTIVSLYSSTSESDAVRQRNRLADELFDQDIWVHKETAPTN